MKNILNSKKIIGIFILIILSIFIVNISKAELFNNILPQFGESREIYKTALQNQTDGDYRTAFKNYNNISKRYVAYDAVLFQQSKCCCGF
ncbi:MAG: hypothetical protein MZV70_70095 [Desulfobacterales bacterium]|nr:hypothetical protein [Desulfobacterales bacterium]